MAEKRTPQDGLSNTCQVTLEVPWEVAELLVEHLSKTVDGLSIQVNARRRFETDRSEERQALDRNCNQRIRKYRRTARLAARTFRKKGDWSKYDGALIDPFAVQLGIQPMALWIAIGAHRRAVLKRQRRKRNRIVVRLYLAGQSNSEIAAELKKRGSPLSRGWIAKTIAREREQIIAERRARLHTISKDGIGSEGQS